MINERHLAYLTNEPMIQFIRSRGISVQDGTYTTDSIVRAINEYALVNEMNLAEVNEHLESWLFQGRKKILFRYFTEELEVRSYNQEQITAYLEDKFEVDEINIGNWEETAKSINITKIKCTLGNTLTNIRFFIIFNVWQRNKDTDETKQIPIPGHIDINLEQKQIIGRISSKSELYTATGEKIQDIRLLEIQMECIMRALGINTAVGAIQSSTLQSVIFKIHNEITELPEEIILKVDGVSQDIEQFTNTMLPKIDIEDDNNVKDSIKEGIKNVLLKAIISMYGEDEKEIFQQGKYAISTGVNIAGISKSKVEFMAPAREPVQCNPEYQHIKDIMGDTEKIKKDVILWNSISNLGYKIRMKLYYNQKGYIQVCFEQYVVEDDIEDVLSKIRTFI